MWQAKGNKPIRTNKTKSCGDKIFRPFSCVLFEVHYVTVHFRLWIIYNDLSFLVRWKRTIWFHSNFQCIHHICFTSMKSARSKAKQSAVTYTLSSMAIRFLCITALLRWLRNSLPSLYGSIISAGFCQEDANMAAFSISRTSRSKDMTEKRLVKNPPHKDKSLGIHK